MFRPWTPPLLACALTLLAGCDRRDAGSETASAVTTDTAAGSAAAEAGAVPISTNSDEARRLYLEARAVAEQLRAHEGRQLYEKAAAADPNFAMAHYQLAVNAATAKDFLEHMKQAVALSDRASEGERLFILAAEAGGNANPAKALEYQEELVAKYPRDERAHQLLGTAYFGRQEYAKAIDQYRAATSIDPEFSPAYNLLGYSYRSIEQYDSAEAAFKKYIELIPGDPNPYDSYAELLLKMGRFDESVAQYRKALEHDSNFVASKVGIATNLMYQGKHRAGAAEMDRLYQHARDDGERRTALFVKGVILVDAGKTDAALKEIQREYDLDAKLADTANMSGDALLLGNILLDAGRVDAAEKQFGRSLDLVARSSLSEEVKEDTRLADQYNRGRIALARGEYAAAGTAAEAYLQGAQGRNNVFRIRQAHEFAGRIALAQKNYDQAIAHLGQANLQDPGVVYATALAWKGKGDAAKAKALAAEAADANVLPLISYAFVRDEARRMS
ncbi:MAG TPA: tetratricopeptide repeat protein [Gemmatimonadales bacterium]|nr:tetratricopeptide repeat protein [Gemmatimonadales bacterium]